MLSLLHALTLNWRLQRWRSLGDNCSHKPLIDYYESLNFILSAPFRETKFLAVDLEMTGLNPVKDDIVSIGYVPIINGEIRLADAKHQLISSDNGVGESAVIHNIRDQDLKKAMPLNDALDDFLLAAKGHVLLVHHAPLDMAFLKNAFRKIHNSKFCCPVVDTMKLEHRRFLQHQTPIKNGDLRLFNCRTRYHLPTSRNHNALTDALATAELFLAITAYKGEREKISLSELVCN